MVFAVFLIHRVGDFNSLDFFCTPSTVCPQKSNYCIIGKLGKYFKSKYLIFDFDKSIGTTMTHAKIKAAVFVPMLLSNPLPPVTVNVEFS